MCQNHRVFLYFLARPTISSREFEGDTHRLPRWRIKNRKRPPRAAPAEPSPQLLRMRENPFSVNTVWGKTNTVLE